MAPIVHGLEVEYQGKIDFAYLDIDDPRVNKYKQALGYIYQPNYFLLDPEGNIVKVWIGYVDRDDFVSTFDQALSNFQ